MSSLSTPTPNNLYAELNVDIKYYEDATRTAPRGGIEIDDVPLDNTLVLNSSGRVQLAANAGDTPVAFQNVTQGALIILRSNSPFTVKFNSTTAAGLQLSPQNNSTTSQGGTAPSGSPPAVPAFLVCLASAVTAIYLSNPTGTASIQVDVDVVGT